jgi:hypothetical protein
MMAMSGPDLSNKEFQDLLKTYQKAAEDLFSAETRSRISGSEDRISTARKRVVELDEKVRVAFDSGTHRKSKSFKLCVQ